MSISLYPEEVLLCQKIYRQIILPFVKNMSFRLLLYTEGVSCSPDTITLFCYYKMPHTKTAVFMFTITRKWDLSPYLLLYSVTPLQWKKTSGIWHLFWFECQCNTSDRLPFVTDHEHTAYIYAKSRVILVQPIREVLGMNSDGTLAALLGGLRGAPQSLLANFGIISRLGKQRFLPNPF
jgi:hypothetical protein